MSDIKRTNRQKVAAETLHILAEKKYLNSKGETIDLQAEIDYAVAYSKHFRPADFAPLLADTSLKTTHKTHIEVTNETTLACAARLWRAG